MQKVKLAAIKAEWDTTPAPAAFTVVGMPNQEKMETGGAITIPWVMGLITTRSLDKQVEGIKDLIENHEERIRSGIIAYKKLNALRNGDTFDETKAVFEEHKADLGYGLLLKAYVEDSADATDAQIPQAAKGSIPHVSYLFWSFRIMVAFGFFMLLLFALSFYKLAKGKIEKNLTLLKVLVWCIPLPWLACEFGWFVAEFERRPWAIGEVLPTFLAASALTVSDLVVSIAGYLLFYSVLLVIEMYLMFRFARLGPSSLHTGRYHHETGGDMLSLNPAE